MNNLTRMLLSFISASPLKKDGNPDLRYNKNRHWWKGYNNGKSGKTKTTNKR